MRSFVKYDPGDYPFGPIYHIVYNTCLPLVHMYYQKYPVLLKPINVPSEQLSSLRVIKYVSPIVTTTEAGHALPYTGNLKDLQRNGGATTKGEVVSGWMPELSVDVGDLGVGVVHKAQ
jgi:hypothetical protein